MRGEVEGVRARWCWWMLYSRLIQRDSPRDASRSSNKALLFFLFFFSLSIAGCAPVESSGPPVFPLSHLRMPQKVFLADIGPVSVLMFQMNIAMLLRPCRGVTWGVRIDAGLMSNLQLRDCHSTRRVVLHSGDSLLQPL